jgi:hypothetical protein
MEKQRKRDPAKQKAYKSKHPSESLTSALFSIDHLHKIRKRIRALHAVKGSTQNAPRGARQGHPAKKVTIDLNNLSLKRN